MPTTPVNCLNQNVALQNVVRFLHQDRSYPLSVAVEQNKLKVKVKAQQRQELAEEASRLRERLPMQMQRVMDCNSEKGHQTGLLYCPWMSWDSAYTRVHSVILCAYCVCGKRQTVEHALSCSHGGFPALRHNVITGRCISEVCHNVAIEPELQPLTGEKLQLRTANSEEGAWLDVSAQGFLGERHQRAFLMSGFLTHVYRAIASPPKLLCAEDMRMKREGATNSEY